ncbi:siderophore-interacting protein [Olivibacter sitiensis]|uniref:siderophore-interacting protein n=1 Tax=Olivibacter sitiensis TaxID=376470 RepID=UPI00040EF020|nr:siderophore-interacting protein [Olivibacter sitiensis]
MSSTNGVLRAILTVKEKFSITPHYIRVVLTGPEVEQFAITTIGVNNKIFLPPRPGGEIVFPIFENGAWILPNPDEKPIVRTYTHRGIDMKKQEMWVDFVNHGDSGPASAWANRAQPGDKLGIAMKGHPVQLYPNADWYLLVGDATAIPVLSAILESLPASAKGEAFIEVQGQEDEQTIATQTDVDIHWLHNPHPGINSPLEQAVRQLSLPDGLHGTRFAYVAAEFSSVQAIRQYLRKEQFWDRDELYAFSYWKYGKSEDGSAQERREERKNV